MSTKNLILNKSCTNGKCNVALIMFALKIVNLCVFDMFQYEFEINFSSPFGNVDVSHQVIHLFLVTFMTKKRFNY